MSAHNQPWKHEPISSPLRARLNRWLFDIGSPVGRRVNQLLMLVIICSVVIGMLGTVEHLEERWQTLFYMLEIGVTALFVIEYLLRLFSARRPLTYALSFYGIIDLATILPLLLFGDANTVIRLLRVFRLLKLIRYLKALQLFVSSLRDVFEIMVVVISAISIIVLVAGNLIYFLEPQNISNAFEGCWWSLVTMTTVGYGDIVPHSTAGRVLASGLIIVGVSMFAMLTGVISVKVSYTLAYRRECVQCERMVPQEFIYCPFCGANQHRGSEDEQVIDAADRRDGSR
jgi:voltage-gated potassium channel